MKQSFFTGLNNVFSQSLSKCFSNISVFAYSLFLIEDRMLIISKNAETKDLTRNELAFAIRFIRRNYGLRLTVKQDRFYLSKRFQRLSVTKEKAIVSRDLRFGAMLHYAKQTAKACKLGLFNTKGK